MVNTQKPQHRLTKSQGPKNKPGRATNVLSVAILPPVGWVGVGGAYIIVSRGSGFVNSEQFLAVHTARIIYRHDSVMSYVCLSVCLSSRLCVTLFVVAKTIHLTAKVSDKVNRKYLLGTRWCNIPPLHRPSRQTLYL